jgi:hypothetical protein
LSRPALAWAKTLETRRSRIVTWPGLTALPVQSVRSADAVRLAIPTIASFAGPLLAFVLHSILMI